MLEWGPGGRKGRRPAYLPAHVSGASLPERLRIGVVSAFGRAHGTGAADALGQVARNSTHSLETLVERAVTEERAHKSGTDDHAISVPGDLRRLVGARHAEADADALPLTDNLHPSPEAHQLIGERFSERALAPGGLLEGLR